MSLFSFVSHAKMISMFYVSNLAAIWFCLWPLSPLMFIINILICWIGFACRVLDVLLISL